MIPVTAVQYRALHGAVQTNLENLLSFCNEAVLQNSKLIVLPEMCLTGYIWPEKKEISLVAEEANGKSFQAFSSFCQKNQTFLAYGFAEKDRKDLYNSQNLIGPDGRLLCTYRKTHLYETDESWSLPGNTGFKSIETEIGRLGMGICMDLNYDDFTDFHIAAETDILLFSTNWLEEGLDVHLYWLYRLAGFKKTAIAANSWGIEAGTEFCGRSAIIKDGCYTVKMTNIGDGILTTAG